MIKGSGKLNKETYESLLKQGISAEDIRKGEKTCGLWRTKRREPKSTVCLGLCNSTLRENSRWVAFPMECWVGVLRDEEYEKCLSR